MTSLAHRKVKMKNLEEFDDWLHVISDPIVMKVYLRNDDNERRL